MLTCKEASELISQSYERRLSWGERLGLRLHLAICAACAQFARQMRFLRAAARALGTTGTALGTTEQLSPEARQRIAATLKRTS
jgi:hypothetical protein